MNAIVECVRGPVALVGLTSADLSYARDALTLAGARACSEPSRAALVLAAPGAPVPALVPCVRVGEGELWAADLSGSDSGSVGVVDVSPGDADDSAASGENARGGRVALTFPPEAVVLSREEAHASPRSVLPGTVAGIDVDGSLVSVRVALAEDVVVTARVTASAWADLGLVVGDSLWASVKATQVRAIPVAVGS